MTLTCRLYQTIIECLKYATTGDQPPNTRGGAFVHDPKMAAEKEVKAEVKLRFKAANGHQMLVTRRLSVTLKRGAGMTMKTLEAVLTALPYEGGIGKVTMIHFATSDNDQMHDRGLRSLRSVQKWMQKFLICSAFLKLSWTTSFFATKKTLTGRWRKRLF